jgi:hypothetical protein
MMNPHSFAPDVVHSRLPAVGFSRLCMRQKIHAQAIEVIHFKKRSKWGFYAGTPENFVTLGSTHIPSKFPSW